MIALCIDQKIRANHCSSNEKTLFVSYFSTIRFQHFCPDWFLTRSKKIYFWVRRRCGRISSRIAGKRENASKYTGSNAVTYLQLTYKSNYFVKFLYGQSSVAYKSQVTSGGSILVLTQRWIRTTSALTWATSEVLENGSRMWWRVLGLRSLMCRQSAMTPKLLKMFLVPNRSDLPQLPSVRD